MNNNNLIRNIYKLANLIERSGNDATTIGLAAKIRYKMRNSPSYVFDTITPMIREHHDNIRNRNITVDMIMKTFGLGIEYASVIYRVAQMGDDIYDILNDISDCISPN